ncbi:MAG TPA: DUF3047 domain-containing protein [Burkholderiaceae bacterium]|nr:DUF3047 domain-containing protein [Burkholderiaceae bacterium]
MVAGLIAAALAALVLTGCASVAPDRVGPPAASIAPFASLAPVPTVATDSGPASVGAAAGGWVPWQLHPKKARTRYSLVSVDGRSALRADADSSASGMVQALDADPAVTPVLAWSWRVDRLIEGADSADRHADDSPVRVMIAFDGDVGTLPLKERMLFERVALFGGRPLPYATLAYIWDNDKPVGTIVPNPHTSRIQKIVVASGPQGLHRWQSYQRDIVSDYRRAFGSAPGRVTAVAVMTDTDNTRTRATAFYGDIQLMPRPLQAGVGGGPP